MAVALLTWPTSEANTFEQLYAGIMAPKFCDGVYYGVANQCEVYADGTSGMTVKIKTGQVIVGGFEAQVSTEQSLAIPAAHATLNRYDRIVARLNRATIPYVVSLDVIQGTAAGSPQVPALVNNASTMDLPLAIVTVGATVSAITADKVTLGRAWTEAGNGWKDYAIVVYSFDSAGTGTNWVAPAIQSDAGNRARYRVSGKTCRVSVKQLVHLVSGAGWEYGFSLPVPARDRNVLGTAAVQNQLGYVVTLPKNAAISQTGTEHSIVSIRKYNAPSGTLTIPSGATFDGFDIEYEIAGD